MRGLAKLFRDLEKSESNVPPNLLFVVGEDKPVRSMELLRQYAALTDLEVDSHSKSSAAETDPSAETRVNMIEHHPILLDTNRVWWKALGIQRAGTISFLCSIFRHSIAKFKAASNVDKGGVRFSQLGGDGLWWGATIILNKEGQEVYRRVEYPCGFLPEASEIEKVLKDNNIIVVKDNKDNNKVLPNHL